ncbi:MAG: Holliday junction branch migration protein RuvA [Kiritimatiellae bacterium]|nr:Holliday junction branch migration protein RuvA [Kiritimatiellia bacterium]
MIVHLNGELVEKSPSRVTIEACGVGYEAFIPLSTFDRLPGAGQHCKLFTYHAVREDDQILYGFATPAERDMFTMLLGVSGVGPKLALALLSGMNAGDLQLAIAQGDSKRLANVKGVGRKTAERLVVELKDKINPVEAFANARTSSSAAQAEVLRDAMLALSALGFSDEIARKNIQRVLEEDPSAADVETIVRRALGGK